LTARKGGQSQSFAVGDGFVEITGDRVSVMTDMAIDAAHIDEAKAEEARKRAESRLAEKLDEEEVAAVNASLANSLAQLKVTRRQPGLRQCSIPLTSTGSTLPPIFSNHLMAALMSARLPSSSRLTIPISSVTLAWRILVTTGNLCPSFQINGSLMRLGGYI